MRTTKVAITIDKGLLAKLDRLVDKNVFPNRSMPRILHFNVELLPPLNDAMGSRRISYRLK